MGDDFLVGGFNPPEKNARQIGSPPQIGMEKKLFETTLNPPPSFLNGK